MIDAETDRCVELAAYLDRVTQTLAHAASDMALSFGEPDEAGGWPPVADEDHDAARRRGTKLMTELRGLQAQVERHLKATPPTTIGGLLAKLHVALDAIEAGTASPPGETGWASAAIRDAIRFLSPAGAHPDAALACDCAELIRMDAEYRATPADRPMAHPPKWDKLLDRVTTLEAMTEAGHRAKLSVAAALLADELEAGEPTGSHAANPLLVAAIRGLALPLGTAEGAAP